MDLYIDLENIESIIKNRKHSLYNDVLKTMQRQLSIVFNFTKDELKNNESLLSWFKYFTEGVGVNGKHFFSDAIFPDRPLKSNCYISFTKEQLSSMYLINDERIQILKDKGAILVGAPGEEFDVFNQIYFFQSDYKFEKKLEIGGEQFSHWQHLENYASAVTDILLIDGYILSDHSVIDYNLIPLLKSLVHKSRCRVNLVLYVRTDQVSISYADLSAKIRAAIISVTGVSPNFTLVKVRDQKGIDSYAEHDRTIFTNYARMYSGDSFNYFKANGSKMTKGREVHFSSFGDQENHILAMGLISDIQNNLNQLPEDVVEGNKSSNFLTFK